MNGERLPKPAGRLHVETGAEWAGTGTCGHEGAGLPGAGPGSPEAEDAVLRLCWGDANPCFSGKFAYGKKGSERF